MNCQNEGRDVLAMLKAGASDYDISQAIDLKYARAGGHGHGPDDGHGH